jgi:peptidyl-prolyl cis-trans isomerase SurA
LIRKRIEDKELTFEEAARKISDEKRLKQTVGALIEPQNTRYPLS